MTCDPSALVDALLDARCALLAAQRMSTKGAPLWKTLECSIGDVDSALRIARAMAAASKAAV